MYRLRADHAADLHPARVLLSRPRRACLFLRVRWRGDRICSQMSEGHLAIPTRWAKSSLRSARGDEIAPARIHELLS